MATEDNCKAVVVSVSQAEWALIVTVDISADKYGV